MQNILILGSGLSASTCIQYLLDHSQKENWKIILGDINEELARQKIGNHPNGKAVRFDVLDEVHKAGLYRELWQTFGVLPAIRSVGVQGDERTYAYPLILRAVTSDDAMTADWARLPYEVLASISSRVINEVPGINRVAYDISSKPPSTIEWE